MHSPSAGEPPPGHAEPQHSPELGAWVAPPPKPWTRYGGAVLVVAACTLVAIPMHRSFDLSNLTMVYLLGVVVAAIAFGRGPAILASVLGVAAFDFGFVPPRFTLQVSDAQYLVTFGVMLAVALVTGTLTARLRDQLEESRRRERRSAALERLSRELASRTGPVDLIEVAARHIADILAARVAVSLGGGDAEPRFAAGDRALLAGSSDRNDARRAFESQQIVGWAGSASGPDLLHVPLEAGLHAHGVLSARPLHGGWDPERFRLLRMLASQSALAFERGRLVEEAHAARTEIETERARSLLLSSVSHDLRTPLTAITGAATSLQEGASRLSESARRELAATIAEESHRLNRLIGNILEMTRLESGDLRLRRDWHTLEDVVGSALVRLEPWLHEHPLRVAMPPDLPLVWIDDVLFEQVVWNLVENAVKYAPPGEPIDLEASAVEEVLTLRVADRGPGLEPEERERVFEKFSRGRSAVGRPGAGLGLAICRGIVHAHGGTLHAEGREGGGAVFVLRMPLKDTPPSVEREASGEAVATSPR